MTILPVPSPGDWCVVGTGSSVSAPIQFAEYLADKALGEIKNPEVSQWDHALMCVNIGQPLVPVPGMAPGKVWPDNTVWIAEAEPGGARYTEWHYSDRPHQWSTGIIDMPMAAGVAAFKYTQPGPWGPHGVPYSDMDYAALTAHSLHIPLPGLQEFIETSEHMICSQLVDRAAHDGGKELFTDKRWFGYVKPSDLGWLLLAARA